MSVVVLADVVLVQSQELQLVYALDDHHVLAAVPLFQLCPSASMFSP